MNRCPITYQDCGDLQYSIEGLYRLSKNLTDTLYFHHTREEQLKLAARYATKLSIQGVQPKLSVRLDVPNKSFEIVETRGTYIIKPPSPYFQELPQNEDLTMRLAAMVGIDVPLHGMVYCADGSLSYFIKRFDRYGHGKKLGVEDFAQLSNATRETKYGSSMEQLGTIIEKFCTFPVIEKLKLFRITLFCFLIGNEDMHLKNFSLIRRADLIELSPAYDLLNFTIALKSNEELALPLQGKKSKFKREHFIEYFALERLKLHHNAIEAELRRFSQTIPEWKLLLERSFLSNEMKNEYDRLIDERTERLFLP